MPTVIAEHRPTPSVRFASRTHAERPCLHQYLTIWPDSRRPNWPDACAPHVGLASTIRDRAQGAASAVRDRALTSKLAPRSIISRTASGVTSCSLARLLPARWVMSAGICARAHRSPAALHGGLGLIRQSGGRGRIGQQATGRRGEASGRNGICALFSTPPQRDREPFIPDRSCIVAEYRRIERIQAGIKAEQLFKQPHQHTCRCVVPVDRAVPGSDRHRPAQAGV